MSCAVQRMRGQSKACTSNGPWTFTAPTLRQIHAALKAIANREKRRAMCKLYSMTKNQQATRVRVSRSVPTYSEMTVGPA